MHQNAELVRTAITWSLRMVEGDRSKFPGPRLAQLCLGRLMARSDPRTTLDIAREIGESPEVVRSYASEEPRRRTGREDSLLVASAMLLALRSFGTQRDRDLIETCCSVRTWANATRFLPGRHWESVRDDFEIISLRLYLRESTLVNETTEYARKILLVPA